ncbi:hypothetical protein [Domibacillus tundrae]|uniref:hypothetical protein n=1 Tax=Domibacillus tundrae TaxID=1587527 RepID=UPI0033954261
MQKVPDLTYRSSQLSGDMQYYHRQLEKLSLLLGSKYNATSLYPPEKPKGMHWRTYERHAQRYLELVEKREEAFMKGAEAVLKRFYKHD